MSVYHKRFLRSNYTSGYPGVSNQLPGWYMLHCYWILPSNFEINTFVIEGWKFDHLIDISLKISREDHNHMWESLGNHP